MAYGYGLNVSLLQLARAYTVFANNGELLPITLLRQDMPATGVSGLDLYIKNGKRWRWAAGGGPEEFPAREPGGLRGEGWGVRVSGWQGVAHLVSRFLTVSVHAGRV